MERERSAKKAGATLPIIKPNPMARIPKFAHFHQIHGSPCSDPCFVSGDCLGSCGSAYEAKANPSVIARVARRIRTPSVRATIQRPVRPGHLPQLQDRV